MLKRILFILTPLLVAGLSIYLNGPHGNYAGKGVGSVIGLGLISIYASTLLSSLAATGIRGSTPIEVAPGFFIFLGWVFLLGSFVPLFL